MIRSAFLVSLLACAGVTSSCMTTYDAQGRPVQSVDPGLAIAGVAAAGLVGYAAGHRDGDNYYYRGGGYRRGYYYR